MTQKEINNLVYKIVACAIEVRKHPGPGILESIYEECLIEELKLSGLIVNSQQKVPLIYKRKVLKTDLNLISL